MVSIQVFMTSMASDQIGGDMDGNEVVRIDSKVIGAGMQASPDKSPPRRNNGHLSGRSAY